MNYIKQNKGLNELRSIQALLEQFRKQSLDTFIGIQAMSYNERYFNRIHKGFGQVQDTLEAYFD
ncbi:hypothetical protein FC59_GL001347 [Lactobacillus kitasatonis DSM 16761 = JCM 1039]|uniref:Uncharacterized protein n=1 Tax=Lactobacillus kitasatonis DSM 16761 = JCM 1039 TaxID=1423767 RepID=A0A0R1VH29_9LACO|nr:hypothetical protein FC59_GL001347 [Lactobacillus kitasatonis DSM 16761 = JCM 1039]